MRLSPGRPRQWTNERDIPGEYKCLTTREVTNRIELLDVNQSPRGSLTAIYVSRTGDVPSGLKANPSRPDARGDNVPA
jgi:hypothetical protein